MKLITKSLCIPVESSTIPFLILIIQRSAQYLISQSLLIRLLILAIWLRRKFNWRDAGIIGRLGFTGIGFYLMERYFWIGFSGTSMTVWFGFVGEPTTVNRMFMTYLHFIITHSFASLDMFFVLLVHKNDNFLVYQLVSMMPFMPMRLYKYWSELSLTYPLLC